MIRCFEERLNIVSKAKEGKPIRQLSREYGLHENKILEWVRKYDLYGDDGLKKQPKTKTSGKYKEKLVRSVIEKGVSLAQIVVQFSSLRIGLSP